MLLIPTEKIFAGDGKQVKKPVGAGPSVIAQYLLDTREFNSLAIYVSTNRLPFGVSIWGFTEVNGTQYKSDDRFNLTRSLSEYRFSFAWLGQKLKIKGLVAQVEYNDITPGGGEILRFGVAYRHKLTIPSVGKLGGSDGWLQWRL